MKNNKYPQDQNRNPPYASSPTVAADTKENEIDFIPSDDEVARRAYFSYVNEGSPNGRDVQHWLEAESQLLLERNLTRTHGYHHRTWNESHAA